jgi:hypothetical protein
MGRRKGLTGIDNIVNKPSCDIRLHDSSPGRISKYIGNGCVVQGESRYQRRDVGVPGVVKLFSPKAL